MKEVLLTIDGIKVKAREDETILEVAKKVGIKIPTLCYLKELGIDSSCRMCMVTIVGKKKPEAACSTRVREGMVIETENEELTLYRRNLLRLYLDNHPNDCLTCQKAGECELQELAYKYDVKFIKHEGERKAGFTDTSSPYILRDESKCILCSRCIRTCREVETRKVLSFAERGFNTRVVLDDDLTMEESSCVSCNRCVTACPVGALVDRRAYGKVRSWNQKIKSIKCKFCEYGCNMEVIYEDDLPIAVRAKAPQNGRPLCLKGRLLTELEYVMGVDEPYEKIKTEEGNKFVKTSWAKALGLEGIVDKINYDMEVKND